MAGKIIKVSQAISISNKLKQEGKSIVLAGGCFDILHEGHIYFIKESKKLGDFLFVLLESDENIKKLKGSDRPINDQKNRSIVLSSLDFVDYIIPLRGVTNDQIYDKLIVQIKPNVIAITEKDPGIEKRLKQAKTVDGSIAIIKRVKSKSTTDLINEYG